MNLISSGISFLLAVAYPVAIANQQVVATSITPQSRISDLDKALNRDDMKEIVPQIEATWENQIRNLL